MIFHVTVLGILAVLLFCLFVAALQNRSIYSSVFFSFVFLSMMIAVFGYIFEVFVTNINSGYACVIVKYFGSPYIAPSALLTLMDYHKRRPRLPVVVLILLPAVAMTFLVATWPLNGIYYDSISLFTGGFFTQIRIKPAPVYYVMISYTYLVVVLMCIFGIYHGYKNKSKRKKTVIILLGMLFPFLYNAFYVLGLTPDRLDIAPYFYFGTVLVLGYSILRLDAIDILPQAKEIFLDDMDDALIVVNNRQQYIYANIVAKKIYPVLLQAGGDEPLETLLPMLDINVKNETDLEMEFNVPGEAVLCYRMTKKLISHKARTVGHCIMLHDITNDKNRMQQLKEQAEYDGLTQVYNHVTFYELAKETMTLAAAEQQNCCFFMIDIDFFKSINDTYGHHFGDLILKNTIAAIKKVLRGSDLLGRLGGEEFGVLTIHMTESAAFTLAEKIRVAVSDSGVANNDETVFVTVSIGVALFDSSQPFDTLMEHADMALYQAKNNGRNRVEIWKQP